MPGFSNITGDESIMFANNASFDGTERGGKMTTNGQLWIGSTASPHVRLSALTSTGGTVTITTGAGTINLEAAAVVPALKIAMQTGTSPVSPNGAGDMTFSGAVTAAGTNPVRTDGTAANIMVLEVQTSQALAGADATKIGLSNFDSTSFAVAATGFVTLSTTGAGKTITGDSGGALSPVANNWSILGGPGVTTSGSGSTLTINSVVFTDQTATTLTSDSGTFATAAGAYVLPASPAQGELIEIVALAAGIIVTANTGQEIRLGNTISSSAGTATSTAEGDVLVMRYRTSDTRWYCTSSIGVWVLA